MQRKSDFGFNEEIFTYIGSSKTPILGAAAGISYPDPNYEIIRKNSSTFSIEYIYEGEGAVQQNDKIYKVKKGDFFILHPGTYHHYYSSPKNPWKKIWFLTDGDTAFISHLLRAYKIDDIVHMPDINSPFELEDILQLFKDEPSHFESKLEILAHLLIHNLAHKLYTTPPENTVIANAKLFIDRKIKTALTIDEICKYASISTVYFSRAFKEKYGIAPNKYIQRQKIELAKTLLSTTSFSIKKISDELSFFDTAYFSKTFKKIAGCTPSDYRIYHKK